MTTALTAQVSALREFNRSYTNIIGVLDEGLLQTEYSLTEARVIFELAQRAATDVPALRRGLSIDAGYLSRILARFAADGLITRRRSPTDARRHVVELTEAGRAAYGTLDMRSQAEIEVMLSRLTEEDRSHLLGAMGTIRQVLGEGGPPPGYVLRPLQPGDLGWVVQRHGMRYAEEYGWDATFEALVARIVADYVDGHDPGRKNAWIAEVGGRAVGCVFCLSADDSANEHRAERGAERDEDDVAQLRLLLVEPATRGMGIGARLVDECLRFARGAGYRQMMLWTNDVLTGARRIYERTGFELREEASHHSFGHDLVGQTWWRTL